MRTITRNLGMLLALIGCLAIAVFAAPPAAMAAGPYAKLQVLLPGETEAPGTATGKFGAPTSQTTGTPFSVRVRACDSQWNTVTTVADVIHLTSSDQTAGLPGDAALVAGRLTVSVTLNAAGSFTVSAKDLTDPTIPTATSAYVTSMVLQGFVFSSISQKNQYAGQPMNITVRAVDPNGQVVSGFSGPVLLREITSYGEGRIQPSLVQLANGTWTGAVTMYRADETSINRGNVNIVAALEGAPSKNGTSDPFTVHPGVLARLQIIVPGQDPLPGSISGVVGTPASQAAGQTFRVDVFATDNWWNPAPCGHQVRLTSSDPAASTPVTGTLVNGYVMLSLSLGTVGAQTISARDLTDGSIQSATSAPIQVIPSAVSKFVVGTLPAYAIAGTPVTVTIRATDVGGNTLPGYYGDAHLSANTGPGSITPEQITFAAGTWTGAIVFRGAGGAVSFTCSDYATPPHTGTSASFEVRPGPYAGLQVLLPGETPQGGTAAGHTGVPTVQSAGTGFTLRLRAVDAWFNRIPGQSRRVGLTSTDAFARMPAETTVTNGELLVPVTLFEVGMQTFTATDLDSTAITGTSSEVEVVGGPYSRILVLAPGESPAPGTETGRTGTATDQSISFAFTVTVLATDAWWNPVTGPTDVVHLTSSDPLAQLPADVAMANGRADLIVRLATGGYQQLTAHNVTQPGMPVSTTQVRAISSGLHLEAEVAPTAVQAGEPFALTVKVTNDAGAVIQEINTWVNIEVRHATTQQQGRGALLNTRFQLLQGQRTISETYTFAEPIVMIVTDESGNTPAITDVVTVSPGAPAQIALTIDPTWVHANKHATLQAAIEDAFGNGVPTLPVTFALISGFGTLMPIDEGTDEGGLAHADFLGPRVATKSRVSAVAGELSAEIEVETALVDPNAAGGTITNYPNPFYPDEAPTTIAYVLSADANVRMRIYTLSGGLVLDREFGAGTAGGRVGLNEVQWDATNGKGDRVASGGYIAYVEAEAGGTTLHVMRHKIGVVR